MSPRCAKPVIAAGRKDWRPSLPCSRPRALAEQAGVDAITVHLREDRRHIQPDDVREVKAAISLFR